MRVGDPLQRAQGEIGHVLLRMLHHDPNRGEESLLKLSSSEFAPCFLSANPFINKFPREKEREDFEFSISPPRSSFGP